MEGSEKRNNTSQFVSKGVQQYGNVVALRVGYRRVIVKSRRPGMRLLQ